MSMKIILTFVYIIVLLTMTSGCLVEERGRHGAVVVGPPVVVAPVPPPAIIVRP
jgi:hypothetical protein